MATLTNSDYEEIRQIVRSNEAIRVVFKSWGLSKPTWYSLFQTVEDWFVNGFTTRPAGSLKAAIDTIVGSSTVNQAKQVATVWVKWRFGKEL